MRFYTQGWFLVEEFTRNYRHLNHAEGRACQEDRQTAWPLCTAEGAVRGPARETVQILPPTMGNLFFSFTDIITGAGKKDCNKEPERRQSTSARWERPTPVGKSHAASSRFSPRPARGFQGSLLCPFLLCLTSDNFHKRKHTFSKIKMKKFFSAVSS